MDQNERRLRAERQVAKLKEFYAHFAVYVTVMALLYFLNAWTGGPKWFYWPLFGWGIGLALHALDVFVLQRALGPEWEEKKVEELLKRG